MRSRKRKGVFGKIGEGRISFGGRGSTSGSLRDVRPPQDAAAGAAACPRPTDPNDGNHQRAGLGPRPHSPENAATPPVSPDVPSLHPLPRPSGRRSSLPSLQNPACKRTPSGRLDELSCPLQPLPPSRGHVPRRIVAGGDRGGRVRSTGLFPVSVLVALQRCRHRRSSLPRWGLAGCGPKGPMTFNPRASMPRGFRALLPASAGRSLRAVEDTEPVFFDREL